MTEPKGPYRLGLVTPVFNDWASFAVLMRQIDQLYRRDGIEFSIIAIDDGSTEAAGPLDLAIGGQSCIRCVDIIRLATNLGHQRAIATGLCVLFGRSDFDAVVVMDSDGEDQPADIATLIEASEAHPGCIVMAHRAKRSEALAFRLGYLAYKLLFRFLTGRSISFGNFSLIPRAVVGRLVHMPELWNNLAAAIMRSGTGYLTVPTQRGQRYSGRSQMNLTALIVHGLSAMSIYIDIVFVRVLIGSAAVAVTALIAIAAVATVRFATDLAIPGWATTAVGDLLIVLLQTTVLVIATTLMVLSNRSAPPIVPIRDYRTFVPRDVAPADRISELTDTSRHEI